MRYTSNSFYAQRHSEIRRVKISVTDLNTNEYKQAMIYHLKMSRENAAIEQAWVEYKDKLLSYVRAKIAAREDAEDILNDVFEKLLKTACDNGIPDNPASWLYSVTRNSIVDYYRAKKPTEQLPEDLVDSEKESDAVQQLSQCMLPMINALPEDYRLPLILSEIEGRKQKEVAQELGLTLAAVKSRILRGKEKLQKSMIRCCTIYRNNAGKVIDYEKKSADSCQKCDD